MTFSIVARDPNNGDLGVAVQSKFIAVGAVVPWAKANVGAIATQAWGNVSFGPDGLKLLEDGFSASETLERLLAKDSKPEHRQVGVVDSKGRVAAHTGKECMEWAGHSISGDYACQGNILASSSVVAEMGKAYERTKGDLIDKLLESLSAGQLAGGDRRGQQAAAILIVREKGGYEGFSDRYVDLRVDEHPHPIDELKRVFRIYDITMLSREDPNNLLLIDGKIAEALQKDLKKLGFYSGPENGVYNQATKQAFRNFVNINNFENKIRDDDRIWKSVLDYLEDSAAAV